MGAPEHACVKWLCHECDEVIDGKVLCTKGHHPLFNLSSLSTSPSPQYSGSTSVLFQENHLVLLNFQLSTGLGRRLLFKQSH